MCGNFTRLKRQMPAINSLMIKLLSPPKLFTVPFIMRLRHRLPDETAEHIPSPLPLAQPGDHLVERAGQLRQFVTAVHLKLHRYIARALSSSCRGCRQ